MAEDILLQIANTPQVSPQVIQRFTEEAFITYCENLSNQLADATEDGQQQNVSLPSSGSTAQDKIFELYERLLQAEREKLAYVEKILGGRW